jgi:hypothetical protein
LPTRLSSAQGRSSPNARVLCEIDCRSKGRKYQPVSPEQAEQRIRRVTDAFARWAEFSKRPEVAAAIKQHNREANNVRDRWRQAIRNQADDPKLPGVLFELLEQRTEVLSVFQFDRAIPSPDGRKHIKRLVAVRFVRSNMDQSLQLTKAVRELFRADSAVPMARIFEEAIRDAARREAEAIITTSATYSNVAESLAFTLRDHAESTFRELKGMDLATLPPSDFTILGFDCSLAQRPQ